MLHHACKFSFKINQKDNSIYVDYNWSSKTKSKIPMSLGIIENIMQHFPIQAFKQTVYCYTEIDVEENT